MKEIKAYIRPLCASQVIKELEAAGAKDMTLIPVDAVKPPALHGPEAEAASAVHITRRSTVAKLELVCRDEEVNHFEEFIRASAHTGQRGDGRIFVSGVEAAVNIRTGQIGEAAL